MLKNEADSWPVTISYDFCTSLVLHKVKKTFEGSKWKFIELTRVSRYLAYVKRLDQRLSEADIILVLTVGWEVFID